MPEKRVKGRQRGEGTPVVKRRNPADAIPQSMRMRILVGDKVRVEMFPYDLTRAYRIDELALRLPEGTIEGGPGEIVIEDFDEIYAAVNECVAAVAQAHEEIEKNRREVETLGRETRKLLSELKAA